MKTSSRRLKPEQVFGAVIFPHNWKRKSDGDQSRTGLIRERTSKEIRITCPY
jgi:hypothetical protein